MWLQLVGILDVVHHTYGKGSDKQLPPTLMICWKTKIVIQFSNKYCKSLINIVSVRLIIYIYKRLKGYTLILLRISETISEKILRPFFSHFSLFSSHKILIKNNLNSTRIAHRNNYIIMNNTTIFNELTLILNKTLDIISNTVFYFCLLQVYSWDDWSPTVQ